MKLDFNLEGKIKKTNSKFIQTGTQNTLLIFIEVVARRIGIFPNGYTIWLHLFRFLSANVTSCAFFCRAIDFMIFWNVSNRWWQ